VVRIKRGENELEIKGTEHVVRSILDEYFSGVIKLFTNAAVKEVGKTKREEKRTRRRKGETEELLQRLPKLVQEGTLDQPKTLGEIRNELKVKGWYHSSPMIQNVILSHPEIGIKRIGERGKYKFVKT